MSHEIRLIYTSQATSQLTASGLEALTAVAMKRNAELGITGVLLYGGGRFLQLLEGEADQVECLYDKITQDRRHTDCQVLLRVPCASRLLPQWHMGRLYLQDTEGAAQLSWDALCTEIAKQNPEAVFARDPATACINQFIMHFGDSLDRFHVKALDAESPAEAVAEDEPEPEPEDQAEDQAPKPAVAGDRARRAG